MRTVSRFERKYILDLEQYYRIRNAIVPLADRDPYATRGGGAYLVRSIYFDTRDYRAWYEKEDGDYSRIKLRIRSYTDTRHDCDVVSVEIKTKRGNAMEKYSTFVPYEEYQEFERTGWWPSHDNEIVAEFERLRRVRQLVPICLVQYAREGFVPKDRSAVRITIDHNVVSARARSLFPRKPILQLHRPRRSILEVKTLKGEPGWLTALVREHTVKMTSNSKYWQGIEIIRPNMVTPRQVAP